LHWNAAIEGGRARARWAGAFGGSGRRGFGLGQPVPANPLRSIYHHRENASAGGPGNNTINDLAVQIQQASSLIELADEQLAGKSMNRRCGSTGKQRIAHSSAANRGSARPAFSAAVEQVRSDLAGSDETDAPAWPMKPISWWRFAAQVSRRCSPEVALDP